MVENSTFIKNARTLEKFKSTGSVPDSAYEQAKYVLLVKNDMVCLSANKLLWKDFKDVPKFNNKEVKPVTVILDVISDDCLREICLFAIDLDISNDSEITELEAKVNGKFVPARPSLFILKEREAQYVSQARGLINFCRTTNFCSYCGGGLENKVAGSQKECQKCKKIHYPITTPVGITLIEDKTHNKVLLVRQGRHPKGMYSCVAGFLEAGESVEQNIRREVAEEVGLEVETIEYCSSQHWAMPASQLMLACICTAQTENFELDEHELQDAKWVDAAQLRDAVNRVKMLDNMNAIDEKTLWVPPPTAVAHTLMVTWLKKYHGYVEPAIPHL